MAGNLLSLREAATYKGVPPHVIQRAVDEGELNAVHQGGLFVNRADLEAWEPHAKSADGSDFTDAEAAAYIRTPDTPS